VQCSRLTIWDTFSNDHLTVSGGGSDHDLKAVHPIFKLLVCVSVLVSPAHVALINFNYPFQDFSSHIVSHLT